MKLADDETIVATAAEHHSGPGWANSTLTVVVRNSSGRLRLVVLQPHERTAMMDVMFQVAAEVHMHMLAALRAPDGKPKRRKR